MFTGGLCVWALHHFLWITSRSRGLGFGVTHLGLGVTRLGILVKVTSSLSPSPSVLTGALGWVLLRGFYHNKPLHYHIPQWHHSLIPSQWQRESFWVWTLWDWAPFWTGLTGEPTDLALVLAGLCMVSIPAFTNISVCHPVDSRLLGATLGAFQSLSDSSMFWWVSFVSMRQSQGSSYSRMYNRITIKSWSLQYPILLWKA